MSEIAHSKRGPSTAHRWRRCPGSVRLSEGLPDTAGYEAALGTVFHEHAAMCLEFGLDPDVLVGSRMLVEPHGVIEFSQEMADFMEPGLRYLRALEDSPGAKAFVETRVSLENWIGEGEFGTTDYGLVDVENWRLVVFDWKYGAGVPVSPEENDQAILYALGLWDHVASQLFYDHYLANIENDPEGNIYSIPNPEVWIIIEQPRAPGGGGIWKTDMGDLLARGRAIRRDADRTLDLDAPIVPGPKQCQFCPAAKFNICKARIETLVTELGADFDDLEDDFMQQTPLQLIQARALTPEARSQLLLHKDSILSLLDELHREAYEDAEKGRPTPGLKLVDGRSPARKWRDEKKAEIVIRHRLGEKAFNQTLVSPTQVEKLVGKDDYGALFEGFVDKGRSKPLLVPETDKRKPLPNLRDDFTDDDII